MRNTSQEDFQASDLSLAIWGFLPSESHGIPTGTGKRRLKVMVVDVNTISLTRTHNFLAMLGCDATSTIGLDACMAALRREPFDCVFMGSMLAAAEAREGCRRIRSALGADSTLPVVMLAPRPTLLGDLRAKFAGFDAYLPSPFGTRQLAQLLAQLVPGAHVLPVMPRMPLPLLNPRRGSVAAAAAR